MFFLIGLVVGEIGVKLLLNLLCLFLLFDLLLCLSFEMGGNLLLKVENVLVVFVFDEVGVVVLVCLKLVKVDLKFFLVFCWFMVKGFMLLLVVGCWIVFLGIELKMLEGLFEVIEGVFGWLEFELEVKFCFVLRVLIGEVVLMGWDFW